jgi:hypothetical protein
LKNNIIRTSGIIIPIIIVVFILTFIIFNQYVINSYDGNTYSKNIEQSKINHFFISEYCPNHDSISLIDRKIKAPKCWAEKSWKSKHILMFFQAKEINVGYNNLIIPDTSEKQKHEYMYIPVRDGYMLTNNKEQGYIIQYASDDKEFIVNVVQPSKNEGWAKEIIVDSVKYIKCAFFDN